MASCIPACPGQWEINSHLGYVSIFQNQWSAYFLETWYTRYNIFLREQRYWEPVWSLLKYPGRMWVKWGHSSMWPEHAMNCCSQMTLASSQIYCQGGSPSQPGMMTCKGPRWCPWESLVFQEWPSPSVRIWGCPQWATILSFQWNVNEDPPQQCLLHVPQSQGDLARIWKENPELQTTQVIKMVTHTLTVLPADVKSCGPVSRVLAFTGQRTDREAADWLVRQGWYTK
jgi:hypothetical protein